MFSKLPEPEFDEGTKTHPSFAPQRLLLTREREPFPSLCAFAPPEASGARIHPPRHTLPPPINSPIPQFLSSSIPQFLSSSVLQFPN